MQDAHLCAHVYEASEPHQGGWLGCKQLHRNGELMRTQIVIKERVIRFRRERYIQRCHSSSNNGFFFTFQACRPLRSRLNGDRFSSGFREREAFRREVKIDVVVPSHLLMCRLWIERYA